MDYRRYDKRTFLNFGNIFFVLLVVGLVTLSFVIRANRYFEIKQISPAPERLRLAWKPEELEEASDLVVTGQIAAPGRTYRGETVRYMETRLIVDEVLSGDAAAGDVIIMTEECYTDNFGMTLWTPGVWEIPDTGGYGNFQRRPSKCRHGGRQRLLSTGTGR